MADYWVSQNRKYCNFCKCWITDNKPSVEFHEKGRRHQANVQKHLRTVSRESLRQKKVEEQFNYQLKKIESAALEAYKNDTINNPDYSSTTLQGPPKKLWKEIKVPGGQLCYTNILTNEKKWEPPPEGFLSIAEQVEESQLATKQQLKAVEKHQKQQSLLLLQKQKVDDMEERARLTREKMKERRIKDEEPDTDSIGGPLLEPDKNDPYGKWMEIKSEPQLSRSRIDLQLPEGSSSYNAEPIIDLPPEQYVPKEFKEKIAEFESDSNPDNCTFKKRKFPSNGIHKRHSRQRLNDTD